MAKKTKGIAMPALSEHKEQSLLFKMIALYIPKYPALKYAFAIPNAAKRSHALAAYMKAEGMRSGICDICIPIPSGSRLTDSGESYMPYHALFVEMKKRGNKPTPNQIEYIEYLRSAGYQCNVCYTAEEAMKVILEYLA